ncbi:hypothetical protein Salat_2623900 [Sesamum alatum]|uniref:Uncharacterized protein n=1 Tax=Sesamum alatum TaxID=300844 RepID=A0AAE1XPH0_9LAMI|nr:hypothetical protein Salat_2623900 [Sesamum alatum]
MQFWLPSSEIVCSSIDMESRQYDYRHTSNVLGPKKKGTPTPGNLLLFSGLRDCMPIADLTSPNLHQTSSLWLVSPIKWSLRTVTNVDVDFKKSDATRVESAPPRCFRLSPPHQTHALEPLCAAPAWVLFPLGSCCGSYWIPAKSARLLAPGACV